MNKKFFLLIVSLVLTSMLLGIGLESAMAQEKSPGKPVETIKIGYIGNFSWAVAADAFYAARLAVDEVNKAGGILGRPLELMSEDTRGQAPLATAAYKKFVMSKGATVVMIAEGSEINFACQEAGAELYPEYGHLAMNVTTSHEELGQKVLKQYQRYKFYFRVFFKSSDYFQYLKENAEFMNHYTKAKTAALIVEDALWTEFFRKGLPGKFPPFKQIMEGTGVKIVYYAETAIGEKMYLPVLEALAAKKPDYIYFLCAYSDDLIFVKQWAQSAAADIDFYCNGGKSGMAGFWNMTGGAALGVVSTIYGAKAALSERTIPFIEALKATHNREPNWIAYASYDVPFLLKAAAEKGKRTDPEALIKSLEDIEIAGVSGRAKFDNTHSYKWGFPYMEISRSQYQKDGEYVVVYPFNVAKQSNPDKTFIPVKGLKKKL